MREKNRNLNFKCRCFENSYFAKSCFIISTNKLFRQFWGSIIFGLNKGNTEWLLFTCMYQHFIKNCLLTAFQENFLHLPPGTEYRKVFTTKTKNTKLRYWEEFSFTQIFEDFQITSGIDKKFCCEKILKKNNKNHSHKISVKSPPKTRTDVESQSFTDFNSFFEN